MLIRSGIFLVAGLITIIFKKQLNNLKNHLFAKLNLKNLKKDEEKGYLHMGIVFIMFAVFLFIYSVTN